MSYHRILIWRIFFKFAKGYWTETNSERCQVKETGENLKFVNQYAYPLNTIEKPAVMTELLEWSRKHHVYGLGRWGEHQHYNSDVTVELAMKLAEKMLRKQ